MISGDNYTDSGSIALLCRVGGEDAYQCGDDFGLLAVYLS